MPLAASGVGRRLTLWSGAARIRASRSGVRRTVPGGFDSWRTQLRWFAAAVVVGFSVPFLGSSVLDLHHDLYLGIYFASVLTLSAAYVRKTGLDVRATLSRHWKLGSLLGLVFSVMLVGNVLSEDATPRPDGAYFLFELIWRGGIYGAADALLLTVLPCLVVIGHWATGFGRGGDGSPTSRRRWPW